MININTNFVKRFATSIILLLILFLSLSLNNKLWLLLLLITALICFIEFKNMIRRIFKSNYLVYLSNFFIFIYLLFFVFSSFKIYSSPPSLLIFSLLVCIFSDTGGYLVGKTFGGKKLTKISPNKTISGSLGSFIFSLIPALAILNFYDALSHTFVITATLIMSFICQSGDLLISLFKRKANVKDTGSILPGHGGLLDRIDGMIFVIPITYYVQKMITI